MKGVDGTGIVAIHDAARPCVSTRLINSSFKAASVYKSAVAAVALKDSIREKSGILRFLEIDQIIIWSKHLKLSTIIEKGLYAAL